MAGGIQFYSETDENISLCVQWLIDGEEVCVRTSEGYGLVKIAKGSEEREESFGENVIYFVPPDGLFVKMVLGGLEPIIENLFKNEEERKMLPHMILGLPHHGALVRNANRSLVYVTVADEADGLMEELVSTVNSVIEFRPLYLEDMGLPILCKEMLDYADDERMFCGMRVMLSEEESTWKSMYHPKSIFSFPRDRPCKNEYFIQYHGRLAPVTFDSKMKLTGIYCHDHEDALLRSWPCVACPKHVRWNRYIITREVQETAAAHRISIKDVEMDKVGIISFQDPNLEATKVLETRAFAYANLYREALETPLLVIHSWYHILFTMTKEGCTTILLDALCAASLAIDNSSQFALYWFILQRGMHAPLLAITLD
jgi:hypothetical protein